MAIVKKEQSDRVFPGLLGFKQSEGDGRSRKRDVRGVETE